MSKKETTDEFSWDFGNISESEGEDEMWSFETPEEAAVDKKKSLKEIRKEIKTLEKVMEVKEKKTKTNNNNEFTWEFGDKSESDGEGNWGFEEPATTVKEKSKNKNNEFNWDFGEITESDGEGNWGFEEPKVKKITKKEKEFTPYKPANEIVSWDFVDNEPSFSDNENWGFEEPVVKRVTKVKKNIIEPKVKKITKTTTTTKKTVEAPKTND